jgi:ZIP family zinc transporter
VTGAAAAASWALLVAASLTLGAVAAVRLRLSERIAAVVTAFGGGILLSALARELVPEADARAGPWWTAAGVLAGAGIYVGVDAWLARDERLRTMRRSVHAAAAGRPISAATQHTAEASRGESIAAGIVADGVPESLALGLMAAEGGAGVALLVAVVVGNLTEAYGAAQPIIAGGHSRRFALTLLTGIGLALGATTVLGGTVVAAAGSTFIGVAQAVAAGAILAVLSISILPYAFDEASRRVALAAALGFTVGYLLSS